MTDANCRDFEAEIAKNDLEDFESNNIDGILFRHRRAVLAAL